MAKRLYNKYLREYYDCDVNEFDWCEDSGTEAPELWILKKYCKDNDCEPHEKEEVESLLRELQRREEFEMIHLLSVGLNMYLLQLQNDITKLNYFTGLAKNERLKGEQMK